MKQTGVLFVAIMALMFSSSCKKKKKEDQPEPKIPEYTITGTILDGTNNARAVNMPLEFEILYRKPFGSQNALHKILGKTLTNDTGGFVFTYLEQDVNGLNNPRIKIFSAQFNKDDIPINQNFTERFYQSSLGSLKIFLETDHPLQQNDTLYIGYTRMTDNRPDGLIVDTITSTIQGEYKTIRTPTPNIGVFWGRGSTEFYYDEQEKVLKRAKSQSVVIEGDPIVNEVTIKY